MNIDNIMTKIRLTKEFSFEMAHALEGYDGACRHIHGHSYRLFVTVIGTPIDDINNPKYGMVMDFGDLKKIVTEVVINRYDHALIVRKSDNKADFLNELKRQYQKVEILDYQPTCENMVSHIAHDIMERLPKDVSLHNIKLHETATSFAEWYLSDQC